MTRIAVCLLTCGREAYTARTIDTFLRCNPDRSRFILLHGDDASLTDENCDRARDAGFHTIVRARTRLGLLSARTALLQAASILAPWMLLLENDIESLRAFPWPLFDFARRRRDVVCLRLYGRFKDVARTDACLTTHKREGHRPVDWRAFRGAPEKSQIGRIHWSAQPAVTRTDPLLALHLTGQEPTGLTVRVKKNVMGHIGVLRTSQLQEVA